MKRALIIAGLTLSAAVATADQGKKVPGQPYGPGVQKIVEGRVKPVAVQVIAPKLGVYDDSGKKRGEISRGRRFVVSQFTPKGLMQIHWRGRSAWINGAAYRHQGRTRIRTRVRRDTHMAVINEPRVLVYPKPVASGPVGRVYLGQVYTLRTIWNTWAAIQYDDRFAWVPLESVHVMEWGNVDNDATRAQPIPGSQRINPETGQPYPEPSYVPGAANGDLTVEQLMAIMPRLSLTDAQRYIGHLNYALREASLNTGLRRAMFLAQIAHESVELKHWTELGARSYFDKYEPGTKIGRNLGNTQAGDGYRFRGRGPVQLTGRDNYTRAGRALGLNLVGDPDQVAQPSAGFRAAAWFWNQAKLNNYADAGDFETLTKRLNGGKNGYQDRIRYYLRAKRVLGV